MNGCAVCRRFLGNGLTARTTDKETEVNHQAEDVTRGAVDRRGGRSPRAVDDLHRPMTSVNCRTGSRNYQTALADEYRLSLIIELKSVAV